MPVNLVQYLGAVGVFNNRKFSNRRKYKKMFEPTFLQMYLSIECFLPCNTFYVIGRINLQNASNNVANISAFALFFVTCIHLRTVNWL